MKPIRVLIVEDREDDAILVARELRRAGYEVSFTRVETADDLRTQLRTEPWDVVLSDYSMPSFSAPEALAVVRESDADLPFIVVSGTVGEDVAVEMMRAGAQDYLLKHNLSRLVVAVEREVREAEARRAGRATERALVESEARFERLTENLPDIVYRLSYGSVPHLEFISRAIERVTGRTASQIRADPSLLLEALHPEDLARMREIQAREAFDEPLLVRWRHRDGTERLLDHRSTPIRDRSGRLVGLEGVARDITEQRQLEEQLQGAQRMETVGRLAGGIAHDFNNLLTVINSYSALLLERCGKDEALREDLEQIQNAGQRAAALTSQLLAFSRRQIRQVEPLDVNGVVRNLEKMLQRIIGEDVALKTALAAGAPRILADRAQVEQIIMNLAVNARDAMPGGGVLTLETAHVRLDAEYARRHLHVSPGSYLMIAVSDTGCGMSDEVRARIFEPFFTTKGKDKGTGLGLSTVYGIVKQNEGHIFVYSEVGRGTSFKIYLPELVEASEIVAPRPPRPATGASGGRETILLVEDEDDVRRITSRILRHGGYRVVEAVSLESALSTEASFDGHIDLLLTDIVLTDRSGRDVAEALISRRPDLRVLFMSGYTDNAIVHHGVLDPGTAFLQKPFTPEDLWQKVRSVLDE